MKPTRIVIHCSASNNGVAYPAAQIRKDHIEHRGFKDIAYHKIYQPSGEIENGRPLNSPGAHVQGANEDSLGLCLVGNDRFTRRQLDVLRGDLDSLLMTFSISRAEIYMHRQFPSAIAQGKTCPNIEPNHFMAWYLVHDELAIKRYVLG